MKRLLLFIPIFFCACAPSTTHVDFPGTDQSISVLVHDLRPNSEKQSILFSSFIMNGGYSIYRKGDETLDPPMVNIFRRMVFEKIGDANLDMNITIHHMVVYENHQSEHRFLGIGAGLGGAIGGALSGAYSAAQESTANVNITQSLVDRNQFENSGREEYFRAYYTEAENPDKASVFVIYIDASINEGRVFVKTMAPTYAPGGKSAYSLAVKSAIDYYMKEYSKAVSMPAS